MYHRRQESGVEYERKLIMFYSIDRFEGDIAVLIADADSSQLLVPRDMISPDAGEGGIVKWENGQYIYDAEETAERRRAFFERTRRLARRED